MFLIVYRFLLIDFKGAELALFVACYCSCFLMNLVSLLVVDLECWWVVKCSVLSVLCGFGLVRVKLLVGFMFRVLIVDCFGFRLWYWLYYIRDFS